jgi:putative transposase
MPRGPRLDFPGALQHVMARGIERRRIFLDDEDRERFLARLDRVLADTGTRCFAFATMPNHYHLLLGTRETPLSKVMARLGTAHGIGFNLRHRRVGHLFQNRYRSKLVRDDDGGLPTLVRYIHLNPVKARIVPDLDALADYPWTGHAALLGRLRAPFLDSEAVLACFGTEPRAARRALLRWMRKDVNGPEVPGDDAYDLTSPPDRPNPPLFEKDFGPEHVRRTRLREAGWDPDRVRGAVCEFLAIDPATLRPGRRTPAASRAREAIATLVVRELGLTYAQAAIASGTCRQAVDRALARFSDWPTDRRDAVLRLLPAVSLDA